MLQEHTFLEDEDLPRHVLTRQVRYGRFRETGTPQTHRSSYLSGNIDVVALRAGGLQDASFPAEDVQAKPFELADLPHWSAYGAGTAEAMQSHSSHRGSSRLGVCRILDPPSQTLSLKR